MYFKGGRLRRVYCQRYFLHSDRLLLPHRQRRAAACSRIVFCFRPHNFYKRKKTTFLLRSKYFVSSFQIPTGDIKLSILPEKRHPDASFPVKDAWAHFWRNNTSWLYISLFMFQLSCSCCIFLLVQAPLSVSSFCPAETCSRIEWKLLRLGFSFVIFFLHRNNNSWQSGDSAVTNITISSRCWLRLHFRKLSQTSSLFLTLSEYRYLCLFS